MAKDPTIRFKADTRQLKTAIKDLEGVKKSAFKAGKAANDSGGKFSKFATKINKMAAAAKGARLAFLAVGAAIGGMLVIAANAERGQMRLASLYRSTGGAAGMSAERINELSEEIGRNTLQSAQGMRDAAGALMTFKAISGQEFERTLQLTADMAEILGTDARSAALQFGKALEDPKNGLTMLRRSGISFNKEQKEMIFNLQKSGDLAGAQAAILKILEGQIGGAGAGAGGGLAGAVDLVGENFSLFAENLMKATGITKASTVIMKGLGDAIGAIADALETTDIEKLESMLKARGFEFDTSGLGEGEELTPDQKRAQLVDADAKSLERGSRSNQEGRNTQQIQELQDQLLLEEAMIAEAQFHRDEIKRIEQEKIAADNQAQIDLQNDRDSVKLDMLKASIAEENGLLDEARTLRRDAALLQAEIELGDMLEKNENSLHAHEIYEKKKQQITARYIKEGQDIETKATERKRKADKKAFDQFASLASQAAGTNKKAFELNKKIKIGEAIVSTYNAANDAFDAMAGIPVVGPALGAAAAAAAIAMGMQNVKAIRSTTFQGGGGGGAKTSAPSLSGLSAAGVTPQSPEPFVRSQQPESVINVTINDAIDPAGARRIVEALNEATEDGLEINALVA